jgi:hypothetical protein
LRIAAALVVERVTVIGDSRKQRELFGVERDDRQLGEFQPAALTE